MFGFKPPTPQTYSLEALRMAYQVEQATGKPILNPHHIAITSLIHVDEDWLTDRALFYEWLDFAEQNIKTGKQIRSVTRK